jgi:uncharacterized protein (DUF4415 family)
MPKVRQNPYRKPSKTMRKHDDFSIGKRGAVIASPGKTRFTLTLDDELVAHFRSHADAAGKGYQTLIESALRAAIESQAKDKRGEAN